MEFQGGGNAGRTIYLKFDKTNSDFISYALYAFLVRGIMVTGDVPSLCIVPSLLANTNNWQETQAIAINLDAVISIMQGDQAITDTIEGALIGVGLDVSTAPQITKEQFYDLTTEI